MPSDQLADVEISRRLAADLPLWSLQDNTLHRVYLVNGFRSALTVANAIGHVAEAAWHHPQITISWGKVEVTLWSHDAGGVTERDLALASQIEAVVAWRPGPGSPLEGTPQDQRYAYLSTDPAGS